MEKTASTPIQLFRGMTADELAALRAAHCIRVQRYDKNALIYHAGRVVHEIGIVQSGSVNVESNDLWGNKSILSHVEAGQEFAETYALCGEPLMVDVAAAEPCEILWLDLVPMLQQQNTAASWYPKFLHNLLLLSMQKNLALSQRIRCTTPKSARGRLLTLKLYEQIRKMHPDRKVAEDFIKSFTDEQWQAMIRDIFGKAAETVILQEHTVFHKNDPSRHAKRLDKIIAHWDDILRIIDEELPSCESIAAMMRDLGMPTQPEDINVTWQDTEKAFIGSRDIRDKYLSSSMLWDMGLLYTTKLERG